tara:strand:+ start:733 stop:1512 length:780 start_codon:yes stop_codon:yes gene_type:complete
MLEKEDEILLVVSHSHTFARVLAPANYDWAKLKKSTSSTPGRGFTAYRVDDVTINLKPLLTAAPKASPNTSPNAGTGQAPAPQRDWQEYAQTDGHAKSELLLLRAIRELHELRKRTPGLSELHRPGFVEIARIASVLEQLWQQRLTAKVFSELEKRRILPVRVASVHDQVVLWTAPVRITAEPAVLQSIYQRVDWPRQAIARQLAWQRVAAVLTEANASLARRAESGTREPGDFAQQQEFALSLGDLAGAVGEFAKAPR